MVRPILRTKSISTKLTEEEYVGLERLAAGSGRNMSEWVREVLLQQARPKGVRLSEEALLAEVLGLWCGCTWKAPASARLVRAICSAIPWLR